MRVARRRRSERFYACGALQRPRAARSTRTLDAMRGAAVLLVLSTMTVACSESMEESYATLAEAQAAGAIERGWLPTWLPASSTAIHEMHDLDSNISALSLKFSGSEGWKPPASCRHVSPTDVPPQRMSRNWPTDVPTGGLVTHRHRYYVCEEGTAYLAVNGSSGELYFWRPHGI